MGIRCTETCVECGVKFRQPTNGRPRILCRKRRCELKRRARLRKEQRALERWSGKDLEEAVRVWRGLCGWCSRDAIQVRLIHDAPLPVCAFHVEFGSLTAEAGALRRAALWLSSCKPGCPLPDPYVGGGK
jgi:hypothetical protein